MFLARKGLRESLLSTGLMVVAVAVGVGFEVPSTANIEGYRAELLSQSLDAGFGDVRVRAERGVVVKDADEMATRLSRIAGVTEVDPMLSVPGTVRARGRVVSLYVSGDEPRASFHPYRMTAGSLLKDGDTGVLLGASVARRLDVAIGDEVEITMLLSAYPRLILDDGGYETYKLIVRGLVVSGPPIRHSSRVPSWQERRGTRLWRRCSSFTRSTTNALPRSPPPSTPPRVA